MATDEQMATIEARRVDDTAREMMDEGVTLTWEQADEIGDEGASWLKSRLGLVSKTSDRGVSFSPHD